MLAAAVVLLQLGLIAAVFQDAREVHPHRAPVAVVAPAVVAEALVADVDALDGAPFDAVAATSAGEALRDLGRGELRAVVVVNLATTVDTLLLDAAADPPLNRALEEQVEAVEGGRGRSVVTRLTGPVDPSWPTCAGWRWRAAPSASGSSC